MTGTMTVRVRDRTHEAPWGVGLTHPFICTVTISDRCPRCGGERGAPSNLNQYDDGVHYSVDVWRNPCGHIDSYSEVVREGRRRVDGRAALVRALMSTPFVVNTGEDPLVGGSRPMTGTEANDVADLVFGAAPGREGSPFDVQVLDVEPRHEVQCPACGATIRARMADAPDDQGDDDEDDDAHVLSEPRPSPKPDARGFWIVSCSCGYVTSPDSSAMRARKAAGDHLRAKTATDADDQGDDAETTEALREAAATRVRVHLEWVTNVLGEHGHAAVLDEAVHELEEIAARTGRAYSFSSASVSVTTTPPQSGIDTCRHHPSPRVHPRYEIQESGHAPED